MPIVLVLLLPTTHQRLKLRDSKPSGFPCSRRNPLRKTSAIKTAGHGDNLALWTTRLNGAGGHL
jgi:hypothetical protein